MPGRSHVVDEIVLGSAFKYTRPELRNMGPLEHIKQVAVAGRIFFPLPKTLWEGDNTECRPSQQPGTEEQRRAYVARQAEARSPAAIAAAARRLQSVEELQAIWDRTVNSAVVLSLCKRADSEFMWDRYGARGTGVCIEFDMERAHSDVDWVPFDVEYVDQIPAMNILDYQTPDTAPAFNKHSFCLKRREFSEEEEVRVVMSLDRDQALEAQENGGVLVGIPPGVVRAIYLGPQMDDSHRREILRWETDIPRIGFPEDAIPGL